MVRPGKPLADIGTDHAYLPVSLILSGTIPSAFCADINRGPLERAKINVDENGISDKVTLTLSNGFEKFEPGFCHDFVIAGMGGNLISDILAAAPWLQDTENHFVLQPMTHAEDLREHLYRNGYRIIRESLCEEPGHLYHALEVDYTGEKKDFTISDCYIGELAKSEDPLKDKFFENVLSRLNRRRDALLKYEGASDECEMLTEVISSVKECISK